MEFRKTLANGVEVIANTNTHLHSFCATVRLRGGSAYEKTSEGGLTHLMEHCIVRSLKTRFQGELPGQMSRRGLCLDARTGAIRTEFEISGSPEGIPLAAEMFRRMFLPIELGPRAYRIEKDRVLAEMVFRRGGGGPHAEIERAAMEGSTVLRSPLGTPNRVNRFSRNRLNAHLQSLLVPGNVVLCLTGCIDGEAMAQLLEAAEAIPMYAGQPLPKELPRPRNFGKREICRHYPSDIDYMRHVFDVDPEKCPRAVMGLLREILFAGADALFYTNLSEDTGLIYGYAWPFLEFRNFGTMEFGFHFDPDRFAPMVRAIRRAMEQLEGGEYDLEGKKNMLRTGWEVVQDNPISLNARMLHNLYLTDSPEPPDWDSVTKEEIQACAKTVFSSGVEAIIHRDEWETVEKKMNDAMAEVNGNPPPEAPGKEESC